MKFTKTFLALMIIPATNNNMVLGQESPKRQKTSPKVTEKEEEPFQEERKREAQNDEVTPEVEAMFDSLTDTQLIKLLKKRVRSHRKIIAALAHLDADGNPPKTPTRRASLSILATEL